MRIYSPCLIILLLTSLGTGAPAQEPSDGAATDSINADILWVEEAESLLVAGAGTLDGVGPGTRAVVYVPFFYRGEPYKNRVARGLVISAADSSCQVRLTATTAPVKPGYRVLLYQIQPSIIPPVAEDQEIPAEKPFYKRTWFWPMVGAAVATTIIISRGGGGGKDSNRGSVSISGFLP